MKLGLAAMAGGVLWGPAILRSFVTLYLTPISFRVLCEGSERDCCCVPDTNLHACMETGHHYTEAKKYKYPPFL